MKNARSLALVLAALAMPLFPQQSRAEIEASFEYFQEALSPFGEWIEVADYGLCWRPTGVAEEWAPYTDGYWAYTDAGWTWVSYEDWGGITYHYGRWIHLVDDGWVWVPEYEWGPAWVSWRANDDYVGWAPLPPEARWEENTGFSTWVDTSYDIGPDSYRFCRTRDFGAPVLAPVCVPWRENVVIIQNTVNITNITFNRHNSVVFCGGPNFVNINRHVHRPIPSLKLLREDREVRGNHGHRQPQVIRGNQLAVYAPKVRRPADLKALPVTPRRVVGAGKINRGWSQVPDVAAREQIKQRLQKQTAGLNPRTAPARPVRPADLSSVPQKAQPNAPSPSVVVRDRNAPNRPGRPTSEQPQKPVADGRPVLPRVPASATPPPVAERTRPPQVAVPDERMRDAAADRTQNQREQQQAAAQQREENARRATVVRQQQEAVQRANEIRARQAQQQNEQRAVAERPQRVPSPPQRPSADSANQQQAQAEARRQQALQQRQEIVARQQQENESRAAAVRQQQDAAQRNNQVRQQQEAAQRANAMRQEQAQQMERRQATQQANEMRAQQSQHAEVARQRQEAMQQRGNEMRRQQSQVRQAPVAPPQRQQVTQPSRPAQSQAKEGDDDKRKQRSGR